jgi:hypothetical protein
VQVPVQAPFEHRNGHAVTAPRLPFASHVATPLPLHTRAPGVHCTHCPFRQSGAGVAHAGDDCQVPVLSQVWGTLGWAGSHCVAPGTQVPVHWPLVQPKEQVVVACQVPVGSQVWTPAPPQPTSPGEHWTHWPPRQTGVAPAQGVLYCQLPVASQVRGVSAPQPVSPGEQATHTPSRHSGVVPVHVASARIHCPAVQVSGVWPLHPTLPSVHEAASGEASTFPASPPPSPASAPPAAPELLAPVLLAPVLLAPELLAPELLALVLLAALLPPDPPAPPAPCWLLLLPHAATSASATMPLGTRNRPRT